MIELINSITNKINLLALNTQIEAVRAGNAGAGFNVVANEVKELAKQTAEATGQIEEQVSEMQTNSEAAVKAIALVSDVIDQVSTILQTIVESVNKQSVTVNEIVKNLGYLKNGAQDVASNVADSARQGSRSCFT